MCLHSYTIYLPQKYKISKKLIIQQHWTMLCLQFATLCHFSRHKAVDIMTLNLLVMRMTPFFKQKISHFLSNINKYGLMEFYLYFMHCFIKIWVTVIIISQSLFPKLNVGMCVYISPNNTQKGWIIKCKFLKEWYVEVNACLHACFQLQQTRLKHKNTFNTVMWDKLTLN